MKDFVAANVGWQRSWSELFLSVADGKPLKNLHRHLRG